jgi:sugar (pentulose or hexulose) kinase
VLEGCAFAMRDVVERLAALGVPASHILLMGGAAREPLWARIRADVSGLPVFLVAEVDTAPVGAGLLAAVAAGLRPDLVSCAAELPAARERVDWIATLRCDCLPLPAAVECLRPMFASAEEEQA